MNASNFLRRRAFTVAEAREADQRSKTKLTALQSTVEAFQSFATLSQQKSEWISFASSLHSQRIQTEAALRRCQHLVESIEGQNAHLPSGSVESDSLLHTDSRVPSPSGRQEDRNFHRCSRHGDQSSEHADTNDPAVTADDIWSAETLLENAVMLARLGKRIATLLTGGDITGESARTLGRVPATPTSPNNTGDDETAPRSPFHRHQNKAGNSLLKSGDQVGLSLGSTCCSQSETCLSDPKWSSGSSFCGESDRHPETHESLSIGSDTDVSGLPKPSLHSQMLRFTRLLQQYGLVVIAIEQELDKEYICAQRAAQQSKARLLFVQSTQGSLTRGGSSWSISAGSRAKDTAASPEPGELTEEEENFVESCYSALLSNCCQTASRLLKLGNEYQEKLQRLEEDFQTEQMSMKHELASLYARKKGLLRALNGSRVATDFHRWEGQNRRTGHVNAISAPFAVPNEGTGFHRQCLATYERIDPAAVETIEGEISLCNREVSDPQQPLPQSDETGSQAESHCHPCLPDSTESNLQEVTDTFNFIYGQFSSPGASRLLLLERLQLEFPRASAHVLREVTDLHRQTALLQQRRMGHWQAFSFARIAALAEAQKLRTGIVLRFGKENTKKEERRRHAQKSAEINKRLQWQQAAFEAKELARKKVEDEERARAEETQAHRDAKAQKRQEEMKRRVARFLEHKEEVLKMERAAAEAKARNEAEQYAATRRRNARRIARRRELDAWRDQQREERRRECIRRQEEIVQRIRRAAERLAVVAQSDPTRLRSDTEASRARAEAIKKVRQEELSDATRIKGFGVRHGYGTDTLLRDMRLKLSVALFEAGLLRCEAGHEALLCVGAK
ncbi:hypothetical protein TGME49_213700 [Toxoplasma gondii ME49]|uniref:Uncharacterized protein n=3 Tax=Toxoplasma gondii TaxID=5811 RepID=A0A2G8XYK7_TOXGO|nr:hypothetical protein TGME49_213700 [Toxoplasma gondii ME49]EPT31250.1 hypothetical protein TGME49_213700 [Toxoplasma gondii ME49]KYF43695.1 hypothetical protein TGARI_213700 [Toxoplasma gondii ARI]PIM00096.1 hypothetical protein TGCOUG_213700 [Toxoplasma gondii COUG]|eukprot:XP_002371107.2 hypothetical protein TGME49_213700 [Toxoplasma gondii ME49]